MKFAVITEMKRNFTLIKFIELLFVLWCIGVVTNAQNDEPLRKNASTTVVRLRPTAVVGIMNASETAALSKMSFVVKTQTSVPHHHLSVKATRTIINSSMTVIPTRTLKERNETDTAKGGSSKLGLIIVCTVAVVVVVIVVSIMALQALIYKRRKQSNKRSSNNACRGEMSLSQLHVCPPDTAVADVEIPTSSTNILVGPAAGPTITGDRARTIYDEEANISSSSYTSGACINLGADKSSDGIGESRKDMSLDDNYDKNRRATMSSGISGVSTNFSTGRSSGFGESCEDLSSDKNYDKNRRATMSSHISRASTRRSSGFSESYEDLSLNRTETMSSCISRASTNFSTGRSSGFGESCEDLSSDNNYDKNRRATMSSYISRASTNLSTRRNSGFWESCEDLSLDNKNRTATMSSCISRASTNFSTGQSSGFGESCEDLRSDNNYDKNRRATMSSYPSRASINLSTSGSSGLGESCEDLSLDNSDDMNCKTLPRLSNKEDISLRRAKSYRKARSLSVPASVAKREDWTPMLRLKEHRSKTSGSSKEKHYPNLVKKSITTGGGVIKKDDIILKIGAGCLANDTEITLIQDDNNSAFKALLDFGLVDAAPRVVEFLPDGLKFLKPADLTIRFEKTASDSELSILHGSYNCDYQGIVWQLVTNAIEDNSAEGVVNMKIYGFCFYSYILAKRGRLARILSHLNHSFTCCAYAFYRRPSMDTIDISVVMLSEFVDEKKKEDIKQLKDHFEEGYAKGDKGMGKRVHTKRPLEICLDFPGVESIAFPFKVDQPELDKDGFVIDHFKGIAVKSPACGAVKISEVDRSVENEFVWRMNICEGDKVEKVQEPKAEPEPEPEPKPEPKPKPKVEYRTKLTNREISRMSRMIGVDWDSLAGLMDIPYSEREEIRVNHAKYPDFFSKGEQIFALFNCCECFGRHDLEKCVEELGRQDLKNEMRPVENETRTDHEEEETKPEVHANENVELRKTPLSSREMYRLSRCITVDWDSLAGLMDIAREERNSIRHNNLYNDDRARAEKILSMFNHKKGFTRKKLIKCLKGIKKLDLISPVDTGEWRKL